MCTRKHRQVSHTVTPFQRIFDTWGAESADSSQPFTNDCTQLNFDTDKLRASGMEFWSSVTIHFYFARRPWSNLWLSSTISPPPPPLSHGLSNVRFVCVPYHWKPPRSGTPTLLGNPKTLRIPNTIGIEIEIVLEVNCARGINTTWENLQIEKHKSIRRLFRSPDWFVLFDLQIFSGGVLPPEHNLTHNLFFYFQ